MPLAEDPDLTLMYKENRLDMVWGHTFLLLSD